MSRGNIELEKKLKEQGIQTSMIGDGKLGLTVILPEYPFEKQWEGDHPSPIDISSIHIWKEESKEVWDKLRSTVEKILDKNEELICIVSGSHSRDQNAKMVNESTTLHVSFYKIKGEERKKQGIGRFIFITRKNKENKGFL